MAAQGAIKPVAEVLSEGGSASTRASTCPASSPTIRRPTARCSPSPTTPPRRSSTSTRTSSRRPGSTSTTRRRPGTRSGTRRRRSRQSGAAPCGYTSTWLTWIHLENFAAWNNVPYGTNENGLAGADVELQDQRADLRQPLPGDRRPRQGRHLQVRRPHLRGEADLPRRRMRHLHRQLGRPRRHHQVRHELRHRPAALRQRRAGRAAEHHPRRRQPLGLRRQVGRDLQGRRRLLRLPVADRRAGVSAPDLRLPAGDAGRLRGDQGRRASTTRTRAASTRSCR